MLLKEYYWYFKDALSHKFCDEVIKHGNSLREETGYIGKINDDNIQSIDDKTKKFFKKKRVSNVAWLDESWIYKEIIPYVDMANKNAGWNFSLDKPEVCQFTKYKKNQFYDWHCDTLESPYSDKNKPDQFGKIRKLSVTCSLTDSSEYKGGELEFDFRNQDKCGKKFFRKCTEILSKGSIVVFPSFVWHRVKPIIKGTKYSLVMWNLGRPFV